MARDHDGPGSAADPSDPARSIAADTMIDALPVATAVAGLDGRFLRVNAAYARLHGATTEELMRLRVQDVIHPADRSSAVSPSQLMAESGEPQVTFRERHLQLDDGEAIWVEVTVRPLLDEHGRKLAYVSACTDLETRRRTDQALEEAAWLRRTAGRIARLGGWSIDLPDWEVSWSEEIYDILEVDEREAPTPRQALSHYVRGDRRRVADAIERCAADGVAHDLEVAVLTATGRRLVVRVVIEPRLGVAGEIEGIVGTFQDITMLARAQESSRRASQQLASTLRNMADGVAVYDRDWRISYVNPAAERMVERDRSQLLGRVVWDALPGLKGTEVERVYRQVVATGEPVVNERFRFAPNGRTYRMSALPALDGGLTVYLRDITLEVIEQDRLRELATAEHIAAEELRSLDRMKNAFITAVSHELRTPLTVIQGMSDTLVRLRGLDDPDPQVRVRVEDALALHSRRLGELLDDLLDTDRLLHGSLAAQRQRTDVAEIVREAIEHSPVSDRVVAAFPRQLIVDADPVLVERSIRNLLENAGKYAPEGDIEVRLEPDGEGGFRLSVADEGPGIPLEHRERVFEPFHRVMEHPQPGTGVGLSLVAEFARLHGGRAWVDPDRTPGTRIVVQIPPTVH